MRVVIVGAGASGLVSARHLKAEGIDCEVLEMTSKLGGTWVYWGYPDVDQYGYPIYSAMYQNLSTNIPKELMSFPDFPIPEKEESYITQAEILDYLNQYAEHFQLKPLIKFNRMVSTIRRLEDKWEVESIDKPTKQKIIDSYDAVIVCNGHFNKPVAPKLPGEAQFEGKILHSFRYRSAEDFRNERVLVVGAGPSGFDIALQLSLVAQSVTLSHHSEVHINNNFFSNISVKPDINLIKSREVEFVDGTSAGFDTIIYCTGYKLDFPFLHESCGVVFEDQRVKSLYKHVINIENPSMCFIGLPSFVCHFIMIDLQARLFTKYLAGVISLPSPELMKKDTEEEEKIRKGMGIYERKFHVIGNQFQESYFKALASIAKIKPTPQVIHNIFKDWEMRFFGDFGEFRKDRYKIIDDENYQRE